MALETPCPPAVVNCSGPVCTPVRQQHLHFICPGHTSPPDDRPSDRRVRSSNTSPARSVTYPVGVLRQLGLESLEGSARGARLGAPPLYPVPSRRRQPCRQRPLDFSGDLPDVRAPWEHQLSEASGSRLEIQSGSESGQQQQQQRQEDTGQEKSHSAAGIKKKIKNTDKNYAKNYSQRKKNNINRVCLEIEGR